MGIRFSSSLMFAIPASSHRWGQGGKNGKLIFHRKNIFLSFPPVKAFRGKKAGRRGKKIVVFHLWRRKENADKWGRRRPPFLPTHMGINVFPLFYFRSKIRGGKSGCVGLLLARPVLPGAIWSSGESGNRGGGWCGLWRPLTAQHSANTKLQKRV